MMLGCLNGTVLTETTLEDVLAPWIELVLFLDAIAGWVRQGSLQAVATPFESV